MGWRCVGWGGVVGRGGGGGRVEVRSGSWTECWGHGEGRCVDRQIPDVLRPVRKREGSYQDDSNGIKKRKMKIKVTVRTHYIG